MPKLKTNRNWLKGNTNNILTSHIIDNKTKVKLNKNTISKAHQSAWVNQAHKVAIRATKICSLTTKTSLYTTCLRFWWSCLRSSIILWLKRLLHGQVMAMVSSSSNLSSSAIGYFLNTLSMIIFRLLSVNSICTTSISQK